MSEFGELVGKALHERWRSSPVTATHDGIHDYDADLDRVDWAFVREHLGRLRDHLEALRGVPAGSLSAMELIDRDLLCRASQVEITLEEEVRLSLREADVAPEVALFGCYLLMLRQFAPVEKRMESVLGRLRQVPATLGAGRDNLRQGNNIPKIWTEIAIESVEAGAQFFEALIPVYAEQVPALKDDLLAANAEALEAFADYAAFLKKEVLPRSDGDFAFGRELFEFILREHHVLADTVEELQAFGEETIRQSRRELAEIAEQIEPGVEWPDLVAQLKREHPAADGLLAAYKQAMLAAREFVLDHHLAAIPPGEKLSVMDTPLFERHTVPYAAYVQPAPFEEQQQGFFWVTPVDERLRPEEQEEVLQGHSVYGIPVTALHEGYPGHHLQLCHANRVDSKVRRIFGSTVFVEGWALYCEHLMYEEGFYSDPRVRLLQLKDQLWRACRVVIDVGLHTSGMSLDEAVSMLVDVAHLERPNAVAEVKRYTKSPTQPLSYLVGKRQLLKLRDDYRQAAGDRFNLREFHDTVLSFGSLPVAMIRKAMGLE